MHEFKQLANSLDYGVHRMLADVTARATNFRGENWQQCGDAGIHYGWEWGSIYIAPCPRREKCNTRALNLITEISDAFLNAQN